MNYAASSVLEPAHSEGDAWTLHLLATVESTNVAASQLPAWHAVRAGVQTEGRGRTGRRWVSDAGGLWLSAVVPCPGERERWSVLPLAAGWAILTSLQRLGLPTLRLRWPNDIMCGHRKLAGLLVERFNGDSAVVGIGVNVTNYPEAADPTLVGTTVRLADLIDRPGPLDDLARLILESVRRAHVFVNNHQFSVITNELNAHWSQPRLVSIALHGHAHPFTGLFTGVDEAGRLRITTDYYGMRVYDAAQVSLLRELE